jgi:hypothetical protein
MRLDRRSTYEQWSSPMDEALMTELIGGREAIRSGELAVDRFVAGEGRHGASA